MIGGRMRPEDARFPHDCTTGCEFIAHIDVEPIEGRPNDRHDLYLCGPRDELGSFTDEARRNEFKITVIGRYGEGSEYTSMPLEMLKQRALRVMYANDIPLSPFWDAALRHLYKYEITR